MAEFMLDGAEAGWAKDCEESTVIDPRSVSDDGVNPMITSELDVLPSITTGPK